MSTYVDPDTRAAIIREYLREQLADPKLRPPRRDHHEMSVKGGMTSSRMRRECTQCGLVTNRPNIALHQRKLGHSGYRDLPPSEPANV